MATYEIVAQPSGVGFNVRIEWPGLNTADLAEIAEAIDTFVYTLCETCGFDLDGHVVVPGPFGQPFLYCEKGESE